MLNALPGCIVSHPGDFNAPSKLTTQHFELVLQLSKIKCSGIDNYTVLTYKTQGIMSNALPGCIVSHLGDFNAPSKVTTQHFELVLQPKTV